MKRDTLSEPQFLLSATTTQRPSAAVEAPGYPDDLMQAGEVGRGVLVLRAKAAAVLIKSKCERPCDEALHILICIHHEP